MLEEISTNNNNYKKENPELYKYIEERLKPNFEQGLWDDGLNEDSSGLTQMILYQFSTSLEKITDGRLTSKFIIDKLFNGISVFRFGDFKKGIDDYIKVRGIPVTSDEHKAIRIKYCVSAEAPTYLENGIEKTAIAIHDKNQTYTDETGKSFKLPGLDFTNLQQISHSTFHEMVHVMEKCRIPISELRKKDIIYTRNNSTFINSYVHTALPVEEYKKYINDITLNENKKDILFAGIRTMEIVNLQDTNNSQIRQHHTISEGATEYIATLISNSLGDNNAYDIYRNKVDIMRKIFEIYGVPETISTYCTKPNKIITQLENIDFITGQDALHFLNIYVLSEDNVMEKMLACLDITERQELHKFSKSNPEATQLDLVKQGCAIHKEKEFPENVQKMLDAYTSMPTTFNKMLEIKLSRSKECKSTLPKNDEIELEA